MKKILITFVMLITASIVFAQENSEPEKKYGWLLPNDVWYVDGISIKNV